MDELDFSKPAPGPAAQGPAYNPAVALEFFKSGGTPESAEQGTTFFVENEKASRILLKRDKMYLLLQGEVSLLAHNKVIGDRKSTRLNSSHIQKSRMPSSA